MRKLAVVGIGPGNYENMTIRADRALRECDVIVGYTVYVDLVKERYADKEFLTTPMLREVERCEMALETARGGKTVAMLCSGDSGTHGIRAGRRCCMRCAARQPGPSSRSSPASPPRAAAERCSARRSRTTLPSSV